MFFCRERFVYNKLTGSTILNSGNLVQITHTGPTAGFSDNYADIPAIQTIIRLMLIKPDISTTITTSIKQIQQIDVKSGLGTLNVIQPANGMGLQYSYWAHTRRALVCLFHCRTQACL